MPTQAPQDQDRKAYWRALILDLQLPEEDTQVNLSLIDQVQPHHGIRAAMIAALGDVIAQRSPSARPAFDAYSDSLPKTAFFSFMPVIEVIARFAKAASLLAPTAPLRDTTNGLTRACVHLLADAPFMQAMLRSAEGDLRAFLRSFSGDSHISENFGSRELDINEPRRVRILYRDHYNLFASYYILGVAQGNCDGFNIPADVLYEPLNDTDFFIDTRW